MLQARGGGVATLEKRHLALFEKQYNAERSDHVNAEALLLYNNESPAFLHDTKFTTDKKYPSIITVGKGANAEKMLEQFEAAGVSTTAKELGDAIGYSGSIELLTGDKKSMKPLYFLVKDGEVISGGSSKGALEERKVNESKGLEKIILQDLKLEAQRGRRFVEKNDALFTSDKEKDDEVKKIFEDVVSRYYTILALDKPEEFKSDAAGAIFDLWQKQGFKLDKLLHIFSQAAQISNATNRQELTEQYAHAALSVNSEDLDEVINAESEIGALILSIKEGASSEENEENYPNFSFIPLKTLITLQGDLKKKRKLLEGGDTEKYSQTLLSDALENAAKFTIIGGVSPRWTGYRSKNSAEIMKRDGVSRIDADSSVYKQFMLENAEEIVAPFLAPGRLSPEQVREAYKLLEALNPVNAHSDVDVHKTLKERGVSFDSMSKGYSGNKGYYDKLMGVISPFIAAYSSDAFTATAGGSSYAPSSESPTQLAAIAAGEAPLAGGTALAIIGKQTGRSVAELQTVDGATISWDLISGGKDVRFLPNTIRDAFRAKISKAKSTEELISAFESMGKIVETNYSVLDEEGNQVYKPLIVREIFHVKGGSFTGDRIRDKRYLVAYWAWEKGGEHAGRDLNEHFKTLTEKSGTGIDRSPDVMAARKNARSVLFNRIQRFFSPEETDLIKAVAETYLLKVFENPLYEAAANSDELAEVAYEFLFEDWVGIRSANLSHYSGAVSGMLYHRDDFQYEGMERGEAEQELSEGLGNAILDLSDPDSTNLAVRYIRNRIGDNPTLLAQLSIGRGENFIVTYRKSMRMSGGVDLVTFNPDSKDKKLRPIMGADGRPISIPKAIWTLPLKFAQGKKWLFKAIKPALSVGSFGMLDRTPVRGRDFAKLKKGMQSIAEKYPYDVRGIMAKNTLEKIVEWKETGVPISLATMREEVLKMSDIGGDHHFEITDVLDRMLDRWGAPEVRIDMPID